MKIKSSLASSELNYSNKDSQNKYSKPKHIRLNLFMISMLICISACMALMPVCQCTQIQIVPILTEQHLKTINLMKSLRRIRVRYVNLQNDTYACVTALKQKSLDLKLEASNKSKQISQLISGNLPSQFTLDATLFKDKLDILDDGMVLRQTTKQFIYGYKHKKIISQFDDDLTKYNNQKKEHQNFTMGLFSLDLLTYGKAPEKVSLQYHTYDNDYQKAFINRNITQNKLDNTQYKPISNRYVHEALKHAHIDYLNSIIVLTHPLSTLRHQKSNTYNVTFQCEQQLQSQISFYNYTMIGVSLTNYQILLVDNVPLICKRVTNIVQANIWILSFSSGLNVFDDKLMGDLQQVCGVPNDRSIHPGDYIILKTQRIAQFTEDSEEKQKLSLANPEIQIDIKSGQTTIYSESQKQKKKDQHITEHFLVRIQEVIGEDLYTINTKIPWTIKPKSCTLVEFKAGSKVNYGGQINLGVRKATKQYEIENQHAKKIFQFELMNMKMVRLSKQKKNSKPHLGQNLFCMIEALFDLGFEYPHLESFSLTLGPRIHQDYYEIYPWAGSHHLRVYQLNGYLGKKINCITYQQEKEKSQTKEQKLDQKSLYANPISRILKLSKNKINRVKFENPNNRQSYGQYNIKSGKQLKKINEDSIVAVTLSEDAIIEIHTQIEQPNSEIEQQVTPADLDQNTANKQSSSNKKIAVINKYLVNRQKIYKCETHFKNGTKIKIEKLQNQFYQNNTNENAIIVYKSIWRAGDFLKFPRFLFKQNEKVTQIVVRFGSAFLRIFDLSIINRELFSVASSEFFNYKGFSPFNRPVKSISTEFLFKHGTFCGGNINKNRQTTIKMKCGQSWYKLVSVTELSPCVYQIVIATQFLCDKNTNFPALKSGFNIFPGSICVPAQSFSL